MLNDAAMTTDAMANADSIILVAWLALSLSSSPEELEDPPHLSVHVIPFDKANSLFEAKMSLILFSFNESSQ